MWSSSTSLGRVMLCKIVMYTVFSVSFSLVEKLEGNAWDTHEEEYIDYIVKIEYQLVKGNIVK